MLMLGFQNKYCFVPSQKQLDLSELYFAFYNFYGGERYDCYNNFFCNCLFICWGKLSFADGITARIFSLVLELTEHSI